VAVKGFELLQAAQVGVQHGDMRAYRHEGARRVGSHYACAQHDDVGGRHAGHAAQQDPMTAGVVLQEVRRDIGHHTAGDLAGREQHRQVPVLELNGLVADGGDAAFQQDLQLARVGHGEVQETAEDLAFGHQLELGEQRARDGEDQLAAAVKLLRRVDNLAACLTVAVVVEAAALPRAALDVAAVAKLRQYFDPHRGHADAVVIGALMSGNADVHIASSSREYVSCTELHELREKVICHELYEF
jgi:hypothetical protein